MVGIRCTVHVSDQTLVTGLVSCPTATLCVPLQGNTDVVSQTRAPKSSHRHAISWRSRSADNAPHASILPNQKGTTPRLASSLRAQSSQENDVSSSSHIRPSSHLATCPSAPSQYLIIAVSFHAQCARHEHKSQLRIFLSYHFFPSDRTSVSSQSAPHL